MAGRIVERHLPYFYYGTNENATYRVVPGVPRYSWETLFRHSSHPSTKNDVLVDT